MKRTLAEYLGTDYEKLSYDRYLSQSKNQGMVFWYGSEFYSIYDDYT